MKYINIEYHFNLYFNLKAKFVKRFQEYITQSSSALLSQIIPGRVVQSPQAPLPLDPVINNHL